MNKRNARMSLTFTSVLVALLAGCTSKTDESSASSAIEEGTTNPSCSAPFFSEHPHTGTAALRAGEQVNVPFWACDAAFTVLFGTVDYAPIERLAAGTGYIPIATQVDGVKKAIVRVYMNGYAVSDGGAYREVIFGYETSTKETTIPWLTDYSAAIPAFLPSEVLILHRLYLDQDLPIRYGRELFGLDKRMGGLDYDRATASGAFNIVDDRQQAIMSGDISFNGGAQSFNDFLKEMADALNVPKLPVLGETILDGATVDVEHPGTVKLLSGAVQWSPTVSRASRMTIHVSGDSEIGALLKDANFQARLVLHDPHARFYLTTK